MEPGRRRLSGIGQYVEVGLLWLGPVAVCAMALGLSVYAFPVLDDYAFRNTVVADGLVSGVFKWWHGWSGRWLCFALHLAASATPGSFPLALSDLRLALPGYSEDMHGRIRLLEEASGDETRIVHLPPLRYRPMSIMVQSEMPKRGSWHYITMARAYRVGGVVPEEPSEREGGRADGRRDCLGDDAPPRGR